MAIVLIRTLIIYLSLLVTMRLLGKRQLGEMELSEFVLASLIADLAAHPLQDIGIPLINGLVPVLTLFCCEVLITGLCMKSIRLRGLLYGKPSLLISHGRIIQAEMRSNRFTPDELLQELRSQGIYDIAQVQYAVLETDGTINAMPYAAEKPPCAKDFGMQVEEVNYPSVVISEGRILENNLRWLGFDLKWLNKELKKNSCDKSESVYLMLADKKGRVYITQKEAKSAP